MAWLARLAVSPPPTHTRAATSRVTKNGTQPVRRVTRTWGGGGSIAICQFRFRILASEYILLLMTDLKELFPPGPHLPGLAGPGLMLDLLNKRAAIGSAGGTCSPVPAWAGAR